MTERDQEECYKLLKELLDLKEMRKVKGKKDEYESRKRIAWDEARDFIYGGDEPLDAA